MNLKFKGMDLPDWLQDKLKQMSPYPDFNTLFEILLEDYIKRNTPHEHKKEDHET